MLDKYFMYFYTHIFQALNKYLKKAPHILEKKSTKDYAVICLVPSLVWKEVQLPLYM